MKLIKFLDDVGVLVNSKIHELNRGGCCVFASIVAQRLSEFCEVRIAVGTDWLDNDDTTIDEVREQVSSNSPNEWNNYGVDFGHVIIEFDYDGSTYHYDSNGVTSVQRDTSTFGMPILDGYLTINEAVELASHAEWNPKFDRSQIPKLEKIIIKEFDKFTKSCAV